MKKIEICVAILLNDQNQILATQRQNKDYDGQWEFPGGKIEPGETHTQTLIRELKEELDVNIKVGNHLITLDFQYPKFFVTLHSYWAVIESGDISLLEHKEARWLYQNELDSVHWLEADIEIIELIKNTRIEDIQI